MHTCHRFACALCVVYVRVRLLELCFEVGVVEQTASLSFVSGPFTCSVCLSNATCHVMPPLTNSEALLQSDLGREQMKPFVIESDEFTSAFRMLRSACCVVCVCVNE